MSYLTPDEIHRLRVSMVFNNPNALMLPKASWDELIKREHAMAAHTGRSNEDIFKKQMEHTARLAQLMKLNDEAMLQRLMHLKRLRGALRDEYTVYDEMMEQILYIRLANDAKMLEIGTVFKADLKKLERDGANSEQT